MNDAYMTHRFYTAALEVGARIMIALKKGAGPGEMLVVLDDYALRAEQCLETHIHKLGVNGDTAADILAHRHACRALAHVRARLFYRYVLRWESPLEGTTYETPYVRVGIVTGAIWN